MNKRFRKRRAARESALRTGFEELQHLGLSHYCDALKSSDAVGGDDVLAAKDEEEAQGEEEARDSIISWEDLPPSLDPFGGREHTLLTQARAMRKRAQLESLLAAALSLVRDGDRVVEIGSGSGHVGLLLAHLAPKCRVTLVELNPNKQEMIRKRLAELPHVRCDVFSTIEDFERSGLRADVVVSLHSCGSLTGTDA